MRHRSTKKTLDRKSGPRKALLDTLCVSVITHGYITTTFARARVLRPRVERLVTTAKKVNTLTARRQLLSKMRGNEKVVNQLLTEIGPRYKDRQGGYMRIIKMHKRQGDAADIARIEFV